MKRASTVRGDSQARDKSWGNSENSWPAPPALADADIDVRHAQRSDPHLVDATKSSGPTSDLLRCFIPYCEAPREVALED